MSAGPFVKIGYTANLDKRIEALETLCPYEPSVMCLFAYRTEKAAREMETELHHRLRKHRVRGEWFHRKQVVKYLRLSGKVFEE